MPLLSRYKATDCHPTVKRNVRVSFVGVMLWALLLLSWGVNYRVHAQQMPQWSFGTMWSYLWGGQTF